MKIKLSRQPEKYLAKVPADVREKLLRCIDDISELKGDIQPLAIGGYRYKIHHYRIIFSIDRPNDTACIIEINTRSNIKY